jgi:NADH:ubiquinone oxidoreductase subunit 2 (subunit N)
LQEGQLELLVKKVLWEPLKNVGRQLNAVSLWVKILAGLAMLAIIAIAASGVNSVARIYLSMPISLAMAVVSLSAFSNKRSPFQVWHSVALSSILAGVAVWLMVPSAWPDVALFFSGIIPSWALGILALSVLLRHYNFADEPFVFRAFAETRPGWSLMLFLSFLGLVGFPITPAFLGEDLLLSHASSQHPWFAAPITVSFVINGIAIARVYLRLCMGRPVELRGAV